MRAIKFHTHTKQEAKFSLPVINLISYLFAQSQVRHPMSPSVLIMNSQTLLGKLFISHYKDESVKCRLW